MAAVAHLSRAMVVCCRMGDMANDPAITRIGLLGLGVVGSEVAGNLLHRRHRIQNQVGCPVDVNGVLVRDPGKHFDGVVTPDLITTNPEDILGDPAVDIIVELMGGERPAVDLLRAALSRGKHVVTANKEVMATHGPELLRLADTHNVNLLYEASVGGGIPIIGPLLKDMLANDISSVHAIINGTTNYVLTRMAQEGSSFDGALRQAQELGYAEADPSNDVDGTDAAYKLAILSSLAFHAQVVDADVYREGITRLSAVDFQYAEELGYAIKLLAIARKQDDSLSLRVHPSLVPADHLLAKVAGVFNAVELEGDLAGKVVFHGQGAGPKPTASAVLGDIIEVARNIGADRHPPGNRNVGQVLRVQPVEELVTQYYLRATAIDRAGVLAKIATVFGDLSISIASAIQKAADPDTGTAELVIMTHPAREADIQKAIRQMNRLDVVRDVSNVIRVEQNA